MFFKPKNEKINLKKLFRYNKEKNAFIIDVSIDYYKDLYNDWDFSPFKRRDLDTDLITFIEESSEEIPLRYKVIINFFIPEEMRDPGKEERSKAGLKNFFKYMLYKVESEQRKAQWRAFKYTVAGLFLVFIAFFVKNFIEQWGYLSFLPEGLIIGGWVFIWEVFTILFFLNSERKVKIKEYKRLIKSEINYNYYTDKTYFEKL